MRTFHLAAAVATAIAALAPISATSVPSRQPVHDPDVVFVPTSEAVVDAMLDMARVGPQDVVYDLGCGDGRIVVAAAKRGARAIGVDIDPERVAEANANVQSAGVQNRATIKEGDLFQADIHDATVVTLYLLEGLNTRLKPKLLQDLRPGTRVVSHSFNGMGDWKPDEVRHVDGATVYSWTVPPRGQLQARPASGGP